MWCETVRPNIELIAFSNIYYDEKNFFLFLVFTRQSTMLCHIDFSTAKRLAFWIRAFVQIFQLANCVAIFRSCLFSLKPLFFMLVDSFECSFLPFDPNEQKWYVVYEISGNLRISLMSWIHAINLQWKCGINENH